MKYIDKYVSHINADKNQVLTMSNIQTLHCNIDAHTHIFCKVRTLISFLSSQILFLEFDQNNCEQLKIRVNIFYRMKF